MEEKVVITQNYRGNILYCLGAAVLALVSLMGFLIDFKDYTGTIAFIIRHELAYLLFKIILLFAAFFFGYAFVFLLKRSRNGKDILIADKRGITDNSSAIAFGFIPWRDIRRIYMASFLDSQFIELEIVNEENYLEKLSGWKRKAIKVNKKMGHQAVCITLNSTGVKPEIVLPKIQACFENYKAFNRQ